MKTISLKQRGVVILEALIAILIFSIGILGLIAMYANSVTLSGDAQYRLEAANYANQLLNEIWISADRRPDTDIPPSIASFAFNAGGGACAFNGGFQAAGAGNAFVNDLVARLNAAGTGLPGSGPAQVQVIIGPPPANQVQITICWQTPTDAAAGTFRQHVLVGNVS